jgi:hypothetical protein
MIFLAISGSSLQIIFPVAPMGISLPATLYETELKTILLFEVSVPLVMVKKRASSC